MDNFSVAFAFMLRFGILATSVDLLLNIPSKYMHVKRLPCCQPILGKGGWVNLGLKENITIRNPILGRIDMGGKIKKV